MVCIAKSNLVHLNNFAIPIGVSATIAISWQLVQSVFAVKRSAELWQKWKRQMTLQSPVLPDIQAFRVCASMCGYYRQLISSTGRSMELRLHQQLHTSIYNW